MVLAPCAPMLPSQAFCSSKNLTPLCTEFQTKVRRGKTFKCCSKWSCLPSVNLALPDLKVAAVYPKHVCGYLEFMTTITNVGDGPVVLAGGAASPWLTMYPQDKPSASRHWLQPFVSGNTVKLKKNESAYLSIGANKSPWPAGPYVLVFEVDPNNGYTEANESNNKTVLGITNDCK